MEDPASAVAASGIAASGVAAPATAASAGGGAASTGRASSEPQPSSAKTTSALIPSLDELRARHREEQPRVPLEELREVPGGDAERAAGLDHHRARRERPAVQDALDVAEERAARERRHRHS